MTDEEKIAGFSSRPQTKNQAIAGALVDLGAAELVARGTPKGCVIVIIVTPDDASPDVASRGLDDAGVAHVLSHVARSMAHDLKSRP